jgi:hypothetical protein
MNSKPSWETRVRLVQDGRDRYLLGQPMVDVCKIAASLQLNAYQAEGFASLLDELADNCTPNQLRALAGELRAAASIIDPVRQLAATVRRYPPTARRSSRFSQALRARLRSIRCARHRVRIP